jgi:L-cystine transport system substrate-binding protein
MTFAILRRHFLLGSLSLLLASLFMPVFAADLLDEIKADGVLEVAWKAPTRPSTTRMKAVS